MTDMREAVADVVRQRRIAPDPALVEALLRYLGDHGIVLDGGFARLDSHEALPASTGPDVDRLLHAIGGDRSTSPPTVEELVASGVSRALIEAAARSGTVVQIAPDLVFTSEAVGRARDVVASAAGGITVSAFREALGTSRKYALPLLAYFDRTGVTRRQGDLRYPTRRD